MSDGPFELVVTATAQRGLARLPQKVVDACVEFLAGPVSEDPYRLSKPLQRELAGLRSARRGSYRVVFRIDEEHRRVVVVRVDHRSQAYRGV